MDKWSLISLGEIRVRFDSNRLKEWKSQIWVRFQLKSAWFQLVRRAMLKDYFKPINSICNLGTNWKISCRKQLSCDSKRKAKTYFQWSSFEARQLSSLLDRWCWSWLQNTFRNEINDSLYEGLMSGFNRKWTVFDTWFLIMRKWTNGSFSPNDRLFWCKWPFRFAKNHPFSEKVSAVA